MNSKKTVISSTKWEVRSEDDTAIQIWKYNTDKNKFGPVSVETIWKQWILDKWENKKTR